MPRFSVFFIHGSRRMCGFLLFLFLSRQMGWHLRTPYSFFFFFFFFFHNFFFIFLFSNIFVALHVSMCSRAREHMISRAEARAPDASLRRTDIRTWLAPKELRP
uniref:Uncharacterized protein n=1 Tax=Ixodes ricinus TaxID=34613 RepID=A0A147BV11_IXORI